MHRFAATSRTRGNKGRFTCAIRSATFRLDARVSSCRFFVQQAASESRLWSRHTISITSSTSLWSPTEARLHQRQRRTTVYASRVLCCAYTYEVQLDAFTVLRKRGQLSNLAFNACLPVVHASLKPVKRIKDVAGWSGALSLRWTSWWEKTSKTLG